MKKLNTKILAILLIAFTINLNAQNEDNPLDDFSWRYRC
jgi:hypothetical protein